MSRYTGPSWKISRRLGISFHQKLEKNWHVVSLRSRSNTDQTAVAKNQNTVCN